MGQANDRRRRCDGTAPPARAGGSRELSRCLRCAHIFASVVREVLELEILHRTTPRSVTRSQLQLLKLTSLDGKPQVGQVAGFLGVSPPAASKSIDKLVHLGLLNRQRLAGDRRARLLSTSREGRRVVAAYEALKAERLAPIREAFSREELEQLSALLERFALCLLDQEGTDGDGFCLRCSGYFDPDCPVARTRGGCPYRLLRPTPPAADSGEEVRSA